MKLTGEQHLDKDLKKQFEDVQREAENRSKIIKVEIVCLTCSALY